MRLLRVDLPQTEKLDEREGAYFLEMEKDFFLGLETRPTRREAEIIQRRIRNLEEDTEILLTRVKGNSLFYSISEEASFLGE